MKRTYRFLVVINKHSLVTDNLQGNISRCVQVYKYGVYYNIYYMFISKNMELILIHCSSPSSIFPHLMFQTKQMALFILWTDTIKIVEKKLFAINLIISILKHYCGFDHKQFWNVIIVSNSCIASEREWPAMYGSWTKEYGIWGRYNWRGPPYHMIRRLWWRYSIWIRNIYLSVLE